MWGVYFIAPVILLYVEMYCAISLLSLSLSNSGVVHTARAVSPKHVPKYIVTCTGSILPPMTRVRSPLLSGPVHMRVTTDGL